MISIKITSNIILNSFATNMNVNKSEIPSIFNIDILYRLLSMKV